MIQNPKKLRSIHFVGIKGVGMTPLAIIAKEAGIHVSGSDVGDEFITDAALTSSGIYPSVGFSRDNVQNLDLVVVTGAHDGYGNIEVITAREKNIPVLSQGEAVGLFMDGQILGRKFSGISVAGSHGKTTTTAMIATILSGSGYDPSYLIGTGSVSSLHFPGHYGNGIFFVAEADEYATEPVFDKTPKFLWQKPKIALITNIELDHPDLYSSVDEVRMAFREFAANIQNNGLLVTCGDDEQVQHLLKDYNRQRVTFGFLPKNDFVVTRVENKESQTHFWVERNGVSLGNFVLNLLGNHNVLNALGAIIVALECGISLDNIRKALLSFTGSKRRYEYIGKMKSGAFLYDDYAHHPTEIVKTLEAFRKQFPKSKIICIFQPHTLSRTKMMFEQFSSSFKDVDLAIICNIYSSLREKNDGSVSSEELVKAIGKQHKHVLFLPNLTDVIEYINRLSPKSDSVIITMGAGDVYKIHEKLKIL